jgi:hypothetical protein
MKTATVIYNPRESSDNNPDYIIPEHLGFSHSENSVSIQKTKGVTSGIKDQYADIPPVAIAPPLVPLKGKFILLQLWEGRVVEVRDSEFEAIIIDKTNPELSDELVTIDSIEISPDDLPLLRSGSIFYWSIGYSDYPGRGRVRESKIRFRRLKGWTKKEITHSIKVGKEFAEFFKSDRVCSTET